MIQFFPKQLSDRAFALFVGSLLVTSVLFWPYILTPFYLILGIVCVAGFFYLSHFLSSRWREYPGRLFCRYLFLVAFAIRLVWVTISYFYYDNATGMPFEFEAADSIGYHLDAEWLASEDLAVTPTYLFGTYKAYSDSGYLLYLSLLYRLTGPSVFFARVLKCIWSAWTCMFLYRLATRHFGSHVGQMAALFYCFMPNPIIYCGLHLKETEMIFLLVAAIEQTDKLISSDHIHIPNLLLTALLIFLLFFFRTVLGMAVAFAIITALVFSHLPSIKKWKYLMLIGWSVLTLAFVAGGSITNEITDTWENRTENQVTKREVQTHRGNQWAKYATGAVMAPMMFVVPFPTMVDVDSQFNQQMFSGGNYVRNFLGIFVLIAIFSLFFQKKNWRNSIILTAFPAAYLGIVSLSGYANSERFVLPGLPFLLILAAYGVSILDERNYRWVKIWYWIVPLMPLGWAIFKLGSRGMF